MTMEHRLIDAVALKEAFEEDGHLSGYIEEYIDNCTAIDAVEVVRCAQCVSYRHDPVKHCAISGMQKEDDDYCSCGERREPDGE